MTNTMYAACEAETRLDVDVYAPHAIAGIEELAAEKGRTILGPIRFRSEPIDAEHARYVWEADYEDIG